MVSLTRLLDGLLLVDQSHFKDVATPQQGSVERFNIISYLGGSAPYIQHPGSGISTDIPNTCKVVQVQLLSRHGERYPTRGKGEIYKQIHAKLTGVTWKHELDWLNDLEYFVKDDANLGLETTPENSNGPYAGVKNMKNHGKWFRDRYNSLYENNSILPIFTSNSKRVYQSSIAFLEGFLGPDFDKHSKINIINEDFSSGANSLTPWKSCLAYNESSNVIVDNFNNDYLNGIVNRLSPANITRSDAFELFEYCAYEINVTGKSKVCNLMELNEFASFAYHKDLKKYYSSGPGNSWSYIAGSNLVNASLQLLNEDESKNKIWLSFTHDTDIDHYLTFLEIFTPDDDLPVDKILFNRNYIHAFIAPQAARIYTEKLKCGSEYFVRFMINDAIIPLNYCNSGPGFSCGLNQFNEHINRKLSKVNFNQQCEIPKSDLSFYWDYNTKNYTCELKI